MEDSLSTYYKEFSTECEQITMWCEMLTEVKNQIGTFINISSKQIEFINVIQKEFGKQMNEVVGNITPFSKEPSNLYKMMITFINVFDLIVKYLVTSTDSSNRIISSSNQKLVDNIDVFKETVMSSAIKIMQEVIEIKNKTKLIQDKHTKLKEEIENLQIEKKKIEDDPNTAYNDTLKEKNNSKIVSLIQEMENIVPEMKKCISLLESKKESFNSYMKDTFELVVMNVFKGIVYLHQFFFLVAKELFDRNTELKKIIIDKLNLNNSNTILINDFTERKFAMYNGIYFEPIHFSSEFLDTCDEKHNDQNVLSTIDSFLYYTETLIKCMKIRKKLIEHLSEFINSCISDCKPTVFIEKTQNKINTLIKEYQYIGDGTKKSWNYYLQFFTNSYMLFNSVNSFFSQTTLESMRNYVNETKKDCTYFEEHWMKYAKKIKDMRDEYAKIEIEYEKNKNKDKQKDLNKKEEKIKKYLNNSCTEFLNKNIKSLRERDRKRAADVSSLIENIIKILSRCIEEIIDISQSQIENVSSLDLYEEINGIFYSYFDKFKIENYENFMERIKIKVLTKIDFEQENISQTTRDYLNGYYNNNSNLSNSFLNISEVNSFRNDSILSEEEDKNIEQEEEKENNDPQIEEEKIKFVEDNHFEVVKNKNINPYKSIKSNELKDYMSQIKEDNTNSDVNYIDNKIELGKEEQLIETFTCKYQKEKGNLYITNNRLIFFNKRQKLSIPFTDIELIKKNDKNNSYSIDVKTTKTLLVFSSFIEREKCIHCINQELEKIKKNSNDTKDDKDISKGSSLKGKSRIQMINRNIAIKEMLSRIHFNNKLTEITTKRFNEFTQENEANKLFFIPEKDFDVNYIDIKDMNINTPLSLIFHYIFNPNTQIESDSSSKSFYENVYTNRGDINLTLTYNDTQNEKIPKFFSDLDYSLDLFANCEEKELTELLNDIEHWERKISFELNFIHPIKKMFIGPDRITMKDIITVYFISPTDLVIDYHSYGSDFPYIDTFVSISQYRFHNDIIFNENKGIFEFKTSCKVNYVIKMIKSCFLESKLKSEGYKTNRDEVVYKIFEPLKDVLYKESESFQDMYIKVFEENIRRNLHKYSDQLPEGYKDEEEKESTIKEGITKPIVKEEHKEEPKVEKEEQKVEVSSKSNEDKKVIYICLAASIFMMIIKMLFQTGDKKGNLFSFDSIVNILILAAVGYLFVKTK